MKRSMSLGPGRGGDASATRHRCKGRADERPQDRPRGMSRRRFGLAAVAVGAVLSAAGAALADASGVVAAVGLAALAQGIGLLVAGAWLALGHNPLDRERR
jgi:hypothetical protein